MDYIPVISGGFTVARHCHEQAFVPLDYFDLMDCYSVVDGDRDQGAEPSLVHGFSYFDVAYFHN